MTFGSLERELSAKLTEGVPLTFALTRPPSSRLVYSPGGTSYIKEASPEDRVMY